jgi:hypothetical protein
VQDDRVLSVGCGEHAEHGRIETHRTNAVGLSKIEDREALDREGVRVEEDPVASGGDRDRSDRLARDRDRGLRGWIGDRKDGDLGGVANDSNRAIACVGKQVLVFAEGLSVNAGVLITRAFGIRNLKDLTALPPAGESAPAWEQVRYRDADGVAFTELDLRELARSPEFAMIGV